MIQLLFIISALAAGTFLPIEFVSRVIFDRLLGLAILFILLILGYDFGSHAVNLASECLQLIRLVATFTICLFFLNFIAVYGLTKLFYSHANVSIKPHQHANFIRYLLESGKYLGCVVTGIIAGHSLKLPLHNIGAFINLSLLVILFIIGSQLRQQGFRLLTIFANSTGIMVSLAIVISSFGAGLLAARILHLQSNEGLVLSSGFGWYSLSGILTGKLLGHQIGTASFFIDFLRELIAIILIPLFGNKNPIPFIGYSGATSLDFSLPVIKMNLGDEVVPIAITSGMILTLLVPILIPLVWLI